MSGESECLNPTTQSRVSKFYPIPHLHNSGVQPPLCLCYKTDSAFTDCSWWSGVISPTVTDKHKNFFTALIPPLVSMTCLHTVHSLNQNFSQLVGKRPKDNMHFFEHVQILKSLQLVAKANRAPQIIVSTACYSMNDLQCLSSFLSAFRPFLVFSTACSTKIAPECLAHKEQVMISTYNPEMLRDHFT